MGSTFSSDAEKAEPAEPEWGLAWLTGWLSVWIFVPAAGWFAFAMVTRNVGAYGLGALVPLVGAMAAIALFVPATIVWAVSRWRDRRFAPARSAVGLTIWAGAIGLLAIAFAEVVGWISERFDASWPGVIGVTLLALSAVLTARRSERRPALVFAASWALLIAVLGFRMWTDLDVDVGWLGPTTVHQAEGQIAFKATRSGAYEIRAGTGDCSGGVLVATGHYEWQPGDAGSEYGALFWVTLPPSVLPLQPGDRFAVCVRDGLAAGMSAAEAAGSGWRRLD